MVKDVIDFSDKMTDITLKIGVALLILILGLLVMKIINIFTKRALKNSKLDESLHLFLLRFVNVLFWILLIITILGTFGVDTKTLIAIVGAAGAAIAIALKETLGNVAGGVMIIINKLFGRGDYIESEEASGVVQDIDLMYTTLKTYDNKVVKIPNGNLAQQTIINYTKEEKRRVDFAFSILPQEMHDVERAKEILSKILDADQRISKEDDRTVVVAGQKEGYVVLEARVWAKTEDYWSIKYDVEELAEKTFREHNISVQQPLGKFL